jgi:adenosylcobinamide-GDP ribazoletransferase
VSETPPLERSSTLADGIRLAIGTLSVFPVRPGVVDRWAGGIAMTVAPLVGVLLGAVAGVVLTLALWLGIAPLPASVLAVGTLALLTRGLHLDGLADLADGLGSGKPAEQALDIMKRSDIGPFGVVTLVFTLLIQIMMLSEATAAGMGPIALVTACVTGRLALTWACLTGIPSARPGGLGSMVAGTVRRGTALVMTLLVLAGTTALAFSSYVDTFTTWLPISSSATFIPAHAGGGILLGHDMSTAFEGGGILSASPALEGSGIPVLWGFPVAVLVGLLAARVLRRRAVRRLGGVTGDVLGALVETAAAAALMTCAMTS